MGKPQTLKDKKGSVNTMGLKNSFEQLYAKTVYIVQLFTLRNFI